MNSRTLAETKKPSKIRRAAQTAAVFVLAASAKKAPEATRPPKPKHRARKAIGSLTAAATLVGGGAVVGMKVGGALKSRDERITALEIQNNNLAQRLGADEILAANTKRELERAAKILTNLSGQNPEQLLGRNLKSVYELPGMGQTVSPERQKILENATVKIGRRLKGGDRWEEWCTGTKVQTADGPAILTAGHCIPDKERGATPQGDRLPAPLALNVTKTAEHEYAVLDARESPELRDTKPPLANITEIAVDTSGSADWALLKPQSTQRKDTMGRTFENLPTLPIDEVAGTTTLLQPGQEAALYSLPQANGNKPVVGTGIYLGSVTAYDFPRLNTTTAYVAVNTLAPEGDACQYSASGSQAMFNTAFTGPLSTRNTIGYGPEGTVTPPDDQVMGQKSRLYIESLLNLDLQDFTSICAFSIPQPDTVNNLVRVLQNPADIPRPEFTGK